MTDSVPAPLSAGPRVPFEDMLTAEEVLGRCLQRRPRTGDAAKMLREIRERYGFDLVRSDAERRDADRSEGGALQQALRVIAPIAHQWEPDDAHRRTGGPILGDFALCEHPRCRAANALLRTVVSEPSSEMAAAISRVQRGIAKRALAATPTSEVPTPARATGAGEPRTHTGLNLARTLRTLNLTDDPDSHWPEEVVAAVERDAAAEPAGLPLDALRPLSEAATPGPWQLGRDEEGGTHFIARNGWGGGGPNYYADAYYPQDEADGEFVVAAVNAIRAALASDARTEEQP